MRDVLDVLLDAGYGPELKSTLKDAVDEQRDHVVYFVERGGLVKIGTTCKLGNRIASLNRGDSAIPGMIVSPVNQLAVMPGGRAVERSIHATFAKLRHAGEWFVLEEPLLGFIRALSDAGDSANEATRRIFDKAAADAERGRATAYANESDILFDVHDIFTPEDRFLHWQLIADRLAAGKPGRYAGITKEVASLRLRALGVPSVVGVAARLGHGNRVLRGARFDAVEAAVAAARANGTDRD